MAKRKQDIVYDNPYAGKCLIYMLENGRIKKTDLLPFVNNRALDDLFKLLIENKIIEIETINKPYLTYWTTLTNKGEKIAELFKKMQNVENEIPENGEDSTNYGTSKTILDRIKHD